MNFSAIRRMISGLFLFLALLMLALGLTLFSAKLAGVNFATYWLVCFLLTGIAAITALADLALIRRKLRKEQQQLIQSTVEDARSEKAKGSLQKE